MRISVTNKISDTEHEVFTFDLLNYASRMEFVLAEYVRVLDGKPVVNYDRLYKSRSHVDEKDVPITDKIREEAKKLASAEIKILTWQEYKFGHHM